MRFRRFITLAPAYVSGIARGLISIPFSHKKLIGFIERSVTEFKGVSAALDEVSKSVLDTDRRLLFYTVGAVITSWAKMEEMLVAVASVLLRTPIEKGGLVMYSIINFNTWLSLINDLFEQDPELGPLKKRWNKISERIREIKDKRDQVAHHYVTGDESPLLPSAYLEPSKFDTRTKTRRQKRLDGE